VERITALTLAEGDNFRAVAMRGLPEAFADVLRRPFPGQNFHERLLEGCVHIAQPTPPLLEQFDPRRNVANASGTLPAFSHRIPTKVRKKSALASLPALAAS
jgi:hypothetical protein